VKMWSATVLKDNLTSIDSNLPWDFLIELCCDMSVQHSMNSSITQLKGIHTEDFMEADPEEKEPDGEDDSDGP
jgi:hypothetical protein